MEIVRQTLDERDRIYMVVTDRFSDGNPANNGRLGCEYRPGDLHFYQGGDWAGLKDKLAYIKRLGFTAVWMSPPQDNALFSRTADEAGYHGYYTRDFFHTNPHFGTQQDLSDLMEEARTLGLKMVLDAQINHTANYWNESGGGFDPAYGKPAPPFDEPSWYHHMPRMIEDFGNLYQRHYCSLGGLSDLAQENPACWRALLEAYRSRDGLRGWMAHGFSAARIDAVMEVPERFLTAFERHIQAPCFGEAYTGDVPENASFQKHIWSVLDFPLHFRMNNVFFEGADWQKVQEVFDQDGAYLSAKRLLTFLDNHDRARFLQNAADHYGKLRMALAFLYCVRGIPIVYYGTEQALGGDWRYTDSLVNDVNRQTMPGYDETTPLYLWIQRLNEIRSLFSDTFCFGEQKTVYIAPGDAVFAVLRTGRTKPDRVLGVFNNSPVPQERLLRLENVPESERWVNLLNTEETVPVKRGVCRVMLPPYGALLLANRKATAFLPAPVLQTTIRIPCDCGWGNALYLRGDTPPLSWEHGIRCDCVEPDLWQCVLERPSGGRILLKALLNDMVWESGDNHSVQARESAEIVPVFR
ncbi:MAG: alpha-amylase [Eubacteriales bacterium]|nr:alpha-amylase [Eubacteriales bacterium]